MRRSVAWAQYSLSTSIRVVAACRRKPDGMISSRQDPGTLQLQNGNIMTGDISYRGLPPYRLTTHLRLQTGMGRRSGNLGDAAMGSSRPIANHTSVLKRQPELLSEVSELIALRFENKELRALVVNLTSIVIRTVADHH